MKILCSWFIFEYSPSLKLRMSMLALMCIAVVNVSSLWMEQADFSLEIGEAAHDTFNVNSNRSLFKLHCTRCLNFNHVLKTFVHDAIGLGKLFFRSSSWVQISSLAHSKPRIFYDTSFIKLFSSKKISCAKLLALLQKTFVHKLQYCTMCLPLERG